MRYFGCHVSTAGGLHAALEHGSLLKVNTIQVHPAPPQRWNSKPFPDNFADLYLKHISASPIKKVFFHGIYLINLASAEAKNRKLSEISLVNYLDLAFRINAEGVIFHVGSAKNNGSLVEAFKTVAEGINRVLALSKNGSRLLLEVSAGGGAVIGSKLEELGAIYQLIDDKSRVGFALDTQHLFASGYDIVNRLQEVIEQVAEILTVEKVWAIHLNDSETDLASRKDRHANLGNGKIGLEALAAFINHPKLKGIPIMLETPALKSLETAVGEVDRLRSIIATF
ncbi:MAG TPA: deoxyribonuclease IV [Oligoflexia bacterium]|nr:deoxyribonuclease IV [Oligoflexia bacterium]HMP26528.1 deoxyribonuclease IV [Oligoflexia bacterium]